MKRATRLFIAARQPHCEHVVSVASVRPHPRPQNHVDPADSVQAAVAGTDGLVVSGWRVYPYDAAQDQVQLEPWFWLASTNQTHWDLNPPAQPVDYIIDQDLAFSQRAAGCRRRPRDLWLRDGQWFLDRIVQPLPLLSTDALFAHHRVNSIAINILAASN